MAFKGRDCISISDFSRDDLLEILRVSSEMEESSGEDVLKGKILATVFYEPSTRTRMSFVSAMEGLGGQVNNFSKEMSSVKKGESFWDTIKVVAGYADIIAIRHPLEGSARLAAEASPKPVINAGDGSNQHPTQTLLDLYTIKKVKGGLEGLKIGLVGDLKYGRTVHSLIKAMSNFDPDFVFIAPDALQVPDKYLEYLDEKGINYEVAQDLEESVGDLDILYVTRIQEERFADPQEYEEYKGVYRIDKPLLDHSKKGLKVMHPLPRVNEIDKSLDDTEAAVYFEQAENGVHVRKALLALLLGEA